MNLLELFRFYRSACFTVGPISARHLLIAECGEDLAECIMDCFDEDNRPVDSQGYPIDLVIDEAL